VLHPEEEGRSIGRRKKVRRWNIKSTNPAGKHTSSEIKPIARVPEWGEADAR